MLEHYSVRDQELISKEAICITVSERLRHLFDMQSTAQKTMFLLHLPPIDPHFFHRLRLLDGLLDTLESFWEGDEIHLRILCSDGEEHRVRDGAISTPRLRLEIVTESETLAERTISAPPTEGQEREALLTLFSVMSSRADLTCLLSPSTFPIRPFTAKSLIDACLSQPENMNNDHTHRQPSEYGVGLFSSKLAQLMLQTPNTSLATMIKGAELGLWQHHNGRRIATEMNAADCTSRRGRGWETQPWKIRDSATFLTIRGVECAASESLLPLIYASIHQ